LEKLRKNDAVTVGEFFAMGCPKMIIPIQTFEDYATYGFDKNVFEVVNKEKERIV